jgi:sulfur carrier protein
MIEISLNNEKKQVAASTVAQLLDECGFVADKVAVAINCEFVARSDYAEQTLAVNDQLDILAAVQGG